MEEIQALIEDLGAKDYKEGVSWKGYKVYIPQYKGNPCIGLPYVVLAKENEARISTPKGSEEYLLYQLEKEENKKTSLEKKFRD